MFRNYFKAAWRTLVTNKLYTTLNVVGLTFGISCFLLIGIYLFDELSYDRQHGKVDRIYRVIEHKTVNGQKKISAGTSYVLANQSVKKIPEVEHTTFIARVGTDNMYGADSKNRFQETVTFSDENLFKVFDFEFIEGDKTTALNGPNRIVLTENLAKRLFNSTHVVGKTVKLSFLDDFQTVTAVIKDHPRNSSFDFPYVITTDKNEDFYKAWDSNQFMVFALLKRNAKPSATASKMTQLVSANYTPPVGTKLTYGLQAMADIHFYSGNIDDSARNSNVAAVSQGNLLYVKIFAVVAIFVLLIASINYMNLTTARASNRLKEIGIRKSVGASRKHLIIQFLVESLIVSLTSFLLSIAVVNLMLPAFNKLSGKQLNFGFATDFRIWTSAILVAITTGLLSGSYPALLLSRFKPVSLLKKTNLYNTSGLSLRKALVVFQFSISIVMIIATIVLTQQVRYVTNKNLGFNKDQLVVIDINSGLIRRSAETVKSALSNIPGVKQVSTTSRVPGEWKIIPNIKMKTESSTGEHEVAHLIGADSEFASTFRIKFLSGRNFESIADSSSIILNETAAKLLNIQELSNQTIVIPERAFNGSFFPVAGGKPFKARVIGIIKDFHYQSLREKIGPLVLAHAKNPVQPIDYFTARIDAGDPSVIIKKIETTMAGIDQENFFEYHLLDEQLALFYIEDKRRETLLICVAIAAIVIACLGLFGLATYTAEQRIKEIGIRKVLGANTAQLVSLLSKGFLKLVVLANIIAFPVAWWAGSRWLQEFAYHIDLSWWVFVLACLAAILIALITVSFQAVRAALANPVKNLRTE